MWVNSHTGQNSPLPDWGRRDLKIGTLRSAVRKLGLDWQEFNES